MIGHQLVGFSLTVVFSARKKFFHRVADFPNDLSEWVFDWFISFK
jgi:hypothetical protein